MTGVGGPLVDASQRPTPQPATESYPPCSRTVTDNCVQTYERRPQPAHSADAGFPRLTPRSPNPLPA